MNTHIVSILAVLLSFSFGLYAGQIEMALFVLIFYCLGLLLVRFLLKPINKQVYSIFGVFFVIYGLLTLLTHIELIKDPYEDYFVHNDAAWSFFQSTMDYVAPLQWSELIKGTLLNPLFSDYPLAELFYGFVAKAAIGLGLVNIRLALRIHVFVAGAIICAIITGLLLKKNFKQKYVINNVLVFGCISYLYISSAIFTRDILMCLAYTAISYIVLLPVCKKRIFKLIILVLIAFGIRPVSGALALAYIFTFFLFSNTKREIKVFSTIILLIIFVVFITYSTFISDSLELLSLYEEKTSSNEGGGFYKVYPLPFPINKIIFIFYMILQPIPLSAYISGDGMSILTIPFVLSPYLISLVFYCTAAYSFKHLKDDKLLSYFIITSILIYSIIIFASPDLRRAFPAIPGLYMAYCICRQDFSRRRIKRIKIAFWPIIFTIGAFFQLYIMLK